MCAPLHRLLFTARPADTVPERVGVPNDAAALAGAAQLALDECLSVTVVADQGDASWARPVSGRAQLLAGALHRPLDTAWRRTSYTALTAGAHDAVPAIASEPEVEEKDDEPATPAPPAAPAAGQDVPSPMADLPGGTAFGTLVHAVLERVDTAADLAAEVRTHARSQLARLGPAGLDASSLVDALLPTLHTPLGPLAGGRSLADIRTTDRLAELDFELPLRGGDRPNGRSTLAELAPLLRAALPLDDPLRGYADLLADPALGDATLSGYLTGSIDAVLRVDGRYVVVDYKTNRLGVPDTPLTAWDYRPAALAEAMVAAHYPLQALLYQVALHRFLRWRLPDYAPARDLGGVLYLFLRGMCGPDVVLDDGSIPGVFAWQPPAALVTAASDLLAGGAR